MSDQFAAIPSRRTKRQVEQPRSGDERERAILEAARTALKSGKFESVSISELAASAEVSRPSFYFYFASKDALLATLIEQVLAEIFSNLNLTVSSSDMDVQSQVYEAVSHISFAWITHREILCAAVELSNRMPTIADIWSNAVIGSVEMFLEKLDYVSWTHPDSTLRRQAHIFAWGQERNLYNLAKKNGDSQAFEALTHDLTEMWLDLLNSNIHKIMK